MTDVSATIEAGDSFPGESGPEFYAIVSIALTPDRPVNFLIQRSLVFGDTINVEIDGDLGEGFPSLRVHMNDGLIVDTTVTTATLPDPRPEPEPDEEEPAGVEDDGAARPTRIENLIAATGEKGEHRTNLVDVLADVMHYADQAGLNFEDALTSATNHFSAESK